MSAWLCSAEHVNFIVNFTADPHKEHFDMLVAENLRSLEARYPGRDFLDEWKQEAVVFKFVRLEPALILKSAFVAELKEEPNTAKLYGRPKFSARLVPTQVVKACDCFNYQACESEDYKTTAAAGYVARVRDRALNAGGAASGERYDRLMWGI
jgi:hypothetical protein